MFWYNKGDIIKARIANARQWGLVALYPTAVIYNVEAMISLFSDEELKLY